MAIVVTLPENIGMVRVDKCDNGISRMLIEMTKKTLEK